MPKTTVELPRQTVALLVGALVLALVGLAFFIGRETANPAPAEGAPAASSSPPPGPAGDPPRARDDRARPESTVAPRFEAPGPAAPATGGMAVTPPAPAPAPAPIANPERAAVARYFQEIEALQTGGVVAGDPQAFAMALLGQSAQGDWSSFDAMTRDQRALMERAQRVTVPPACQQYHSRSLALMRESLTMLESVKTGIQGGNVGALTALTSRAQKLQAEALDVQTLGESLKRQHGIQ